MSGRHQPDPDPLTLPETAGVDLVSPVMRVWLGWVAVTIVVDVVVALSLVLVWRSLEAAFLAFGFGIGWAALTSRVIRKLGRMLRS
jgi:hypothetical protein